MEQETADPERLAARMALVIGVAKPVQHDINNLLTVIFANLEMLKRTAGPGVAQRQLDRVQEAARRFEASTRSMLAMVRRRPGEVAPVRLSDALAGLMPLLGLLLPAPGQVVLEPAADDPPVALERAALEEALVALAQQAAEVLPRGASILLAVRPAPEGVALLVRHPMGLSVPALAMLRALAPATDEEEDGAVTLRLLLPPA